MICEKLDIKADGSEDYAHADTYIIQHSEEIAIHKRPLVIICPGGGYCFTSEREAEMFALTWNAHGYQAIVLWYSVRPAVYPAALLELAKVVKLARERAREWDVDPNQILIQGSSAGGHLAASYGMFWKRKFIADAVHAESEMLRPNGMILNYPVITPGEFAHKESFENLLGDRYEERKEEMSLENQVSDDTPPTFLWHTNEDGLVPAENSLLLALAMRKAGRPVELHMYMKGNHGLGLANELTADRDGGAIETSCQGWFELAFRWTRELPGGGIH
jgi:acetyl esterase/lipase